MVTIVFGLLYLSLLPYCWIGFGDPYWDLPPDHRRPTSELTKGGGR